MNSTYAENEDVYLAESLSDDIFHYYQQLAAQHDEEENDYTLINNDFYENEYIRVFNYSAYNSDGLSHKLGTGSFTVQTWMYSVFHSGMVLKLKSTKEIKWDMSTFQIFLMIVGN
jgi:hypothetical protein